MNRAQRRANKKSLPTMQKKMTHEQRVNALLRNGISPADLDNAYRDGQMVGRRDGIDFAYKMCYASVCLALSDLHGFGRKRCREVLNCMERHIIDKLTGEEACDEVFQRMGLTIDFGDPSGMACDDIVAKGGL